MSLRAKDRCTSLLGHHPLSRLVPLSPLCSTMRKQSVTLDSAIQMMSQSVNAFDFNLNGTLQDTLIHRLEPRTPAPVVQHKSQQENAFGDLTEASRLVGLSDTAVDIWEGRKKVPVYGPNDDVSFHKINFFEPDGKKVTFCDTNYFSCIA